MEPRSVIPRIGKPLISIGLGIILVCGILLLFGHVTPLASAAPISPQHTVAPLAPQAIIPVTTTIQDAIDAASPGDTVEFTGIYTEEVIIDKSLTLRGTSSAATIVYDGNDFLDPPVSSTIHVTATNAVTITNMTLLAVGGPGLVNHSAIFVENSSNVTITGVIIQDYPTGIEVGRTVAGPTGITITNNIIRDAGGGVTGQGGIYFHGSGAGMGSIQATIQSNQVLSYSLPPHIDLSGLVPTLITSNVLTSTGASPEGLIRLDQSGTSLIQNNRLVSNGSSPLVGIKVIGSANPTITQNILDSQILFGIRVEDSAAPVITNSTLSGHGIYGVYIFGNSRPQIFNTNLLSNTISGINISDNAQPQIFNNVITGSGFAAIIANSTVTPTIARNRIIDNENGIAYNSSLPTTTFAYGNTICQNTLGLTNTSGITLNFTGNWWGHNPPLNTTDIEGDPVNTSPISMALSLNPTPALIPLDGTVDITLTMRGGGYNVLDGTGIVFTATAGSLSTANTTTLDGLATTVYTGTVLGPHVITATDECGGIVTDTIIVGEPVLTTTKTAGPLPGATVRPGEAITYTIYVTNTGAYTATGVVFSDTIPAFTQLATATIDAGTINSSNPISATFNPIPPNNGVMSVTVRVTVTLPLTNGTVLTNTGAVSYFNGTTSVITPTNPVTHLVVSSPDITITKTVQPPHGNDLSPGDYITYTIAITNQGDANATQVTISDTVPANTIYQSAGPPPTTGAPTLQWNLGAVSAPTGTRIITFTVRVDSPLPNNTLITNTAQVTSAETSAVITYSNQVTHRVQSAAVLRIVKTAIPPAGSVITPADTITYQLVITNIGDANATSVVITDVIPPEVNFVSGSASAINGTVISTTPMLMVTAPVLTGTQLNGTQSSIQVTFAVTVTTPLTNNTVISNTGYVTHATASVITASNTVTHLVTSSPNVTYTKIADPPAGSSISSSLSPPAQITYTIIVTNDGNADATGLTITDTLPANTSGSGLTPWSPGFLAGNGGVVSNTFVVTVNVPLPDPTVITNVYEVSYNEIPGVFTSISALSPTNIVTHLIRSNPVVSVTKTSVPVPASVVTPGQVIVYSFTVTNSGTTTATNFVMSDTIPANTTYITNSVSASAGASVGQSPTMVTVTQAALSTPGVLTFTFAVSVDNPLPNATIISNQALYTYDQSAVVSQTNVVTHLVQSAPDITLTKVAIPPHGSPVTPGDRITYTITITNNGTADATSAVLTDTVPQYTQYVTGTASPIPASTSPLVWSLGPIGGAGGVVTVTFAVQVDLPLTNALTISNSALLDIAETTGLSQTNVVTHLVQNTTDITFTKSASPPSGSQVSPGNTITYTLVAANTGTQMATGVVMTDSLPAEVNVVSFGGSKFPPFPSMLGNLFTWNVGTLTANETVTATIQVTVTTPMTRGTVITNQGQLLTSQTGLSTTNFVTHTVISTPTLTISKSTTPPSGSGVFPGQAITYTITATNTGNGPATNFLITDTVPVSTNSTGSVNATPGFTVITSTGALTVSGTLGAGQAMDVTFAVTVSTTGLVEGAVLTNTGYVSYAETPVISPTNAVTHVIRLTPALTLTKIADPPGPTIDAGEMITYTVIISNNDAFDATNVVLTDSIPINTNYVGGSFTSTLGTTNGPDPLQVTVGTLAASQVMSFTFQVTVMTPITNGIIISNVARMSAGYLSLVESNEVTHTVVSSPGLIAVKNAVPPSGSIVDPTDGINYVVQFFNTGNGAATNVVITDTIPVSTSLFSTQLIPATSGTVVTSSTRVTVTIPTLAGGGGLVTLLMSVNVEANATPGLVITNAAQIDSDQTVVTSTNTVTHVVRPLATLLITKSADPPSGTSVSPSETITYTLTVTNTGAGAANNLTLTDFLPGGVTYVPGSVSTTPGFNVLSTAPTLVVSGTLLPAATMTATFQVTVSTIVSGTVLTNTAQVSATNASLVNANTIHLVVNPTYNLAITKNASPPSGSTVEPGEIITYTVTVVNNGDPVTNVIISDTLDPNVTLVTSNTTSGSLSGPNPVQVTLLNLGAGQAVTMTMEVQVNGAVVSGTIINNRASVTATEIAALQASGVVTHIISNTLPVPSLAITKTATPPSGSSVGPNSTITYTVTVANSGPGDATNVLITDTLPITWVNLVTASLSNGGAVVGTNPLIADVGTLNASTSVTLTIVVTTSTVLTDTVITNTAWAVADGLAVVTSQAVTHVITATPPVLLPSLAITKTATPNSGNFVEPGDYITYTITVQNSGSGAATGVVISDTLDPNVTLVYSNPTTGTVSGPNPVQVTGFGLPSGQGVTVTLVVTVTGNVNGTFIYNQASVTSTEVMTPQVSGVVTHVISSTYVVSPSFTLTKSAVPASGTPVNPGDTIAYTVVAVNNGGPATNAVLADVIPSGTGYVPGSVTASFGTPSFDGTRVMVDVSNFPASTTLTATFQVTVTTNFTTTISNQATLSSDQTNLQYSNFVTHPVLGTEMSKAYLPIIYKDFTGAYAILQWDGSETVCDKVSDLDGGAGLSLDGRTDGVFWLGVNVGSEGPKLVSDIRLSSTQVFEWDTVVGSGPLLGVFSGGTPLNNSSDGTISGVLFNSGLVWVQLWASDDAGGTRFVPGQYVYTVTINFTDSTSLLSQTTVWGNRPAWCP